MSMPKKGKNNIRKNNKIESRIYTIRDIQVMLDSDLAKLYGVETKYLNRTVKRNIDRFPKEFRFQLAKDEFNYLKFQNGTSSFEKKGCRADSFRFWGVEFEKKSKRCIINLRSSDDQKLFEINSGSLQKRGRERKKLLFRFENIFRGIGKV